MVVKLLITIFVLMPSTMDVPQKKAPEKLPMPQKGPEIAGCYTCHGKEANGKKYKGFTVITRVNDVYVVTWVIVGKTGHSNFTGIGLRKDNQFAVSWAAGKGGASLRGVNLYKINSKAGLLVGHWASIPGSGMVGEETLTFLGALYPAEVLFPEKK